MAVHEIPGALEPGDYLHHVGLLEVGLLVQRQGNPKCFLGVPEIRGIRVEEQVISRTSRKGSLMRRAAEADTAMGCACGAARGLT